MVWAKKEMLNQIQLGLICYEENSRRCVCFGVCMEVSGGSEYRL